MYQALYRKWRPKVFADVVGQPHITDTLRRQVAEGRTSHAYLFTGTRGTGKTTCAKILAKAVNCEQPVNGDPCCQCAACLNIENGGVDVLELDAASNSGVDQVRALRSEAIYSPANVKKRVYIIDEVHMLSDAAFNALLKIMEEPPEHLLFILATTEVHKILPTILSRCQRFSFRRILPQMIAQRLLYVAGQEGIDLKPDGAELLGRLADGALRDGLSLLDQCAASGGTIDADAVLDVLGLTGTIQTAQMMEAILGRDVRNALVQLEQLYNDGKDMGAVISELAILTRDLLLRKTAPEGSAGLLSGSYDTDLLDRLGRSVPGSRFLYMASALQAAAADLHFSANRRLDTELCLLRLCDERLSSDPASLSARIQRLEDALAGAVSSMPPAVSTQTPPGTESRTASRSEPSSGRTSRPEPSTGRASRPEPSSGQASRPEPSSGQVSRPEPPTGRASRSEPSTGRTSRPEPSPERPPMPEPPPERPPMSEPPPERPPIPEPPPERVSRPKRSAGQKAESSATALRYMREDTDLPPLELVEVSPEELPWNLLETPAEVPDEELPWEMADPVTEEPAKADTPAETPEPVPEETPAEPETPEAAPLAEPAETAVAAPPAIGAAIPAAVEPSGGTSAVPVGNWWPRAKENTLNRLPPMYRSFLKSCTGVLEGNIVVIYTPDEITVGRLDNERVRTALLEEAQAAAGLAQITQLLFRVGNPPMGSPEENLKNLLQNFSGQYDNIKIT